MFSVGDEVEVVNPGPENVYTDGEDILGQRFIIKELDQVGGSLYALLSYNGGWWVNAISLSHVDGKSAVERKIAFMRTRWEKRHV